MTDHHTRALIALRRRAAELVITTQFGSASQLERELGVGRLTAVGLILALEENGIVGPIPELGKSRTVLVPFAGVDQLRELIDATFPLQELAVENGRTVVTPDELKRLWFSDDARGLVHDHETNQKVVRMADGREYACALDDPEANR